MIKRLSSKDKSSRIDKNIKKVSKMDRKTYLNYYINLLEKQIREATKILHEKKKELKSLK